MGNSYRIKTVVGQDKQLQVKLDQDYEYLDILSFKIRQRDLYLRNCSDYGVVVGRVVANNGYGIPNARISVFIPLTDEDAQNPIISSLYPYKSLDVLNEDGYRYNLLPYVPSYSGHAATGTFPDRIDALTNSAVVQVYEKYYKYTVKTNQSGDFMILGVPIGMQKLVMDLDLSDIGEFSLTPQDLIRMGRGTKDQFDGYKFKSSSDLNSLPQIVFLTKDVYVYPLWGENEICDLGITRTDFDLTGEANIEFKPTSLFMGSIYSATQKYRLKRNCKVKNNAGELCSLITGPGEILGIRQTIFYDSDGLPVLEQADLPNNGKLIDENGAWMFDVPMNMDYVTTNEFGEQVISNDPNVGIPTSAKYRFKIKWTQSKNINEETRRANYLVPNLREYGSGNETDPDTRNSYAFSLAWSAYTISSDPNAVKEFVDCEDKFYQFEYNKVYTVSSFIDNLKTRSGKRKFLAIKEITDPKCESDNLKHPVNDGVYNPNLLVFVFNFLMVLIQPIMWIIFVIINILAILWPILKVIINTVLFLIVGLLFLICQLVNAICSIRIIGCGRRNCNKPKWDTLGENPFVNIKFPTITYPDCEICSDVQSDSAEEPTSQKTPKEQSRVTGPGLIAPLPIWSYYDQELDPDNRWNDSETQQALSKLAAGNEGTRCRAGSQSPVYITGTGTERWMSFDLPLAEKVNLLNTRDFYYNRNGFATNGGATEVRTKIAPDLNGGPLSGATPNNYHNDRIMILILEDNNLSQYPPGQIVNFVDKELWSKDPNLTGASYSNTAGTKAITGATCSTPGIITVDYGNPNYNQRWTKLQTTYLLPTAKTPSDIYTFATDIEYFQVVTGFTVQTFQSLRNTSNIRRGGLNDIINNGIRTWQYNESGVDCGSDCTVNGIINADPRSWIGGGCGRNYDRNGDRRTMFQVFGDWQFKNILILQRGVDPKSPRYDTDVDISQIFDNNWGTNVVRLPLKFNFPIQNEEMIVNTNPGPSMTPGMSTSTMLASKFINNNLPDVSSGQHSFFKSHFYQPATSSSFSSFTTDAIIWYSHLDADNLNYTIGQFCEAPVLYYEGYTPGDQQYAPPVRLVDLTRTFQTLFSPIRKDIYPNTINYSNQDGWDSSRNDNFCSSNQANCAFNLRLPTYFRRVNDRPSPCYPFSYFRNTNNQQDYSLTPFNVGTNWEYTYNQDNLNGGNTLLRTAHGFRAITSSNSSGSLYRLNGGSYSHQRLYQFRYRNNIYCFNPPRTLGCYPVGPTLSYTVYMSPIYPTGNTITITADTPASETRLVLRSERLPSSSNYYYARQTTNIYDNGTNKFLWQQNTNLLVNKVSDDGLIDNGTFNIESPGGADTDSTPDYEDPKLNQILESFNCENMVGLRCYTSDDEGNITIKSDCDDYVQKGAYVFVRRPFIDYFKDIKNLAEWSMRNRINFALCQGVLSEVFNNNWVNGSLFMFPFQQRFLYNRFNKISRADRCNRVIFLHNTDNNFYYRTTKYNPSNDKFIPENSPWNQSQRGGNSTQIYYPTTIMNLGPKTPLLRFATTSGRFLGYIASQLRQTSFSDTSELINFFALSRMLNNSFLENALGLNKKGEGGGVRAMFSRGTNNGKGANRVDGDYAQAASINSQFGITPFDEDYYTATSNAPNPPGPDIRLYASRKEPLFGVFFSASTVNLEEVDLVSPGRIVFRSNNIPACPDTPFVYGFKTQVVPHYKWNLVYNSANKIFGGQFNNWATSSADIFQIGYQNMDRYQNYYYQNNGSNQFPAVDFYERNYIWNMNVATGEYDDDTKITSTFVVGAPLHFYFGLKQGATSLDKYFTEYLDLELND